MLQEYVTISIFCVFTVPRWTVSEIPSTLGLSLPLDRNCTAEMDVADNERLQRSVSSSSRDDGPSAFCPPSTTRSCSVPAQSSHEPRRRREIM
jgi:hypothetical protein